MKKYGKLPAFGIWKDRPQTDFEGFEEREKAERFNALLLGYRFICGGDSSYCYLNEICPEAVHHEAYDWCNLSDNICIRNTGNSDFDVECGWYSDFIKEIRLRDKEK